jgi:site-specific DNA-methyltransferase (adenine-specific)
VILHGDLFDVLPTLEAESFASCVTDPPYGIGFMGREWDTFSPEKARASKALAIGHGDKGRKDAINPNLRGRRQSPAISPSQIEYNRSLEGQRGFQEWTERWAREVFRVLKPGAHLVVCGAPRSHHRMMCGLEDAGFEVRDCLAWLFGQGFPKSKNLGNGWGTALKPAHEPIVLARKPFKGTTEGCHGAHGTAGLNVDGCRIVAIEEAHLKGDSDFDDIGRWPANVLLDVDAAEILDEQSGELHSGDAHVLRRGGTTGRGMGYGSSSAGNVLDATYGDSGGASRFFYVAKPSREERDLGCDHLAARSGGEATDRKEGSAGLNNPRAGAGRTGGGRNFHPTVKPLALMRWLVRLVTPIGGRVLEPFGGSGTTAMACAAEGFAFTLIEREAEYIPIIEARVRAIAPLFTEAV